MQIYGLQLSLMKISKQFTWAKGGLLISRQHPLIKHKGEYPNTFLIVNGHAYLLKESSAQIPLIWL